jgi:hypothetical protein
MRFWYSVLLLAAVSLAAGCGKSDVVIKELTPEQEREMQQRQKEVEGEEMGRAKAQPKTKKPADPVEDEERRRQ